MTASIAKYRKAWAALVAGLSVVLAAGLITGQTAVWITTGIAAVTATLNVLRAGPNADTPLAGGSTHPGR